MPRSNKDVWVGFFVLLGILALIFLALKSANLLSLDFNKTYQVSAEFSNIGGLKPKAAVRSAGVVVGRVEAIDFDNHSYQAKVILALNNKYQFPKDSSLKILTSGLLGDQYLSIDPGAASINLKQGDTIISTQSALVLENLISQFLFNKAAQPQPLTGNH